MRTSASWNQFTPAPAPKLLPYGEIVILHFAQMLNVLKFVHTVMKLFHLLFDDRRLNASDRLYCGNRCEWIDMVISVNERNDLRFWWYMLWVQLRA